MLKKFVSTLAAFSILATSGSPAFSAAPGDDGGTFFFRYKTLFSSTEVPEQQEKDVVAYYVGGIGFDFSELLPLKSEWQDDSWSVTSGTLPAGITFNSSTRTFEGTPTASANGTVVYLAGIDINGNQVADAKVTFDIYEIAGTPRAVDLYAHTGKYKVDELTIPSGISVDSWRYLYKSPSGVTVNGPYFEGVPTAAGVYPVLIQGQNYMGETVLTFFGKYTVEDGPTFPFIADKIFKLPQLEWGYQLGPFDFGAPSPHTINRAIDPAKAVRYFMEIDKAKSDGLPGSVASNDNAKNLNLKGYVNEPYDTATIRFRALDSDGTEGFSNWFTFGSSDPQPGCAPYSQVYPLVVETGKPANISVPRPFGSQGRLEYFLETGRLPQGLSLDKDTGLISGTPLVAGDNQAVDFRVDVINGSNTVSTTCAYNINVRPGGVAITDETPAQDTHVRTGDVYTGLALVSGGIPQYELSFSDPSALPLTFTTTTKNATSVGLSGVIPTAGPKSIDLKLTNGDGSSKTGSLKVTAHDELSVGTVPTVHIKRLDASKVWGSIPYDSTTVIPDVNKGNQPGFVLSNVGGLPSDIQFTDDGEFKGLTKADAKSYGMFTATMSDYSGDKVTTAPFEVVVDPREEIAIGKLLPVQFRVEDPQPKSLIPMTVLQPPGAQDLDVTWSLNNVNGIALPTWLHFDKDIGKISVDAEIPYADLKSYGPFTLTATDDEGSTVTSSEFNIEVTDWNNPYGNVVTRYRGTVSGDTSAGEANTFVSIPGLKGWIDPDTVIGGRDGVTFLSAEPANPAGLDFYPTDGSFAGVPTEEFNGNVSVRFKDARNREGSLLVPLEVRAYPIARMGQADYDVARLSEASQATPPAIGQKINGFWNNPRWFLDTSGGRPNLPSGMSVDEVSGKIVGRTKDVVGTTVSNLRLKAVSQGANGETLESFTQAFSVTVGDPIPMTLAYAPATAKFLLKENASGQYELAQPYPASSPVPGGSYVGPLAYKMNKVDAVANGMTGTLDANAGNGNLSGFPSALGRWDVTVAVKDAEGRTPTTSATIDVWSTLAGNIELSGGAGSSDASFKLRVGEPFKTDAIGVKNHVGTVVFSTIPAALPTAAAAGFSATDGSFSDDSAIDFAVDDYIVQIQATDRDGRTLSAPLPKLRFAIVPPLVASIPSTQARIDTRQYSAAEGDPIDATFNVTIEHKMGDIRYSVDGALPGTLVNKVYDLKGNLTSYDWIDEDQVAHSLPASTLPQDLPALLPLDALVFDTMTPSLKGIPSKEGNFSFKIKAFDHHADDYIKNVASKVDNNTARTAPITIAVKAANPFVVANTMDSETIYQFTTVPTLRTVASNAAYGRPVSWTAVGPLTLPQNVSHSKGATAVSYGGYPEQTGTFDNLVWTAKDAAKRSGTSAAATLKVEPRKQLELIASDDPAVRLVNVADAALTVTPRYSAYGLAIPDDKWSVSGTDRLPPGVTYKVANNAVSFSGIPTVTGTYEGFTISAVDSLGSSKTMTVKFVVIEPTDEIRLSVSNVSTKKNISFQMQASATNTYGKVQFYSYDIDGDPRAHVKGQYAADLDIDVNTGLVSGAFATVGDRDFDVWVTDTTKRVTSKPVKVSVIPDLRVTVPTLVQSQQAVKLERAIDTTYSLGTVTYEKGAGDWPFGVEVDAVTGTIRSKYVDPVTGEVLDKMQAASGTYAGLTVMAVDTFVVSGTTYTDRQSSNQFSILVDQADVLPVITTPVKTILGTQNTAITAWRPVVKDDVEKKAWNYGGTKYKLSTDVTQYGLSFDENTGVISGTAHTPFIVRDMVITVTSQRGDSSKTNPFWIGVAPDLPLQVVSTQKKDYGFRLNSAIATNPIIMKDQLGNMAFTKPVPQGLNLDGATGVYSYPATGQPNNWLGTWSYATSIKDEFDRTATWDFSVAILNPFSMTVNVTSGGISRGIDQINLYPPTVSGGYGNVTYTATGLPPGISINSATGALSGKVPDTEAFGTEYNVTVTAKDDYALSPQNASASYTLKLYDPTKGHRYWKLTWTVDGLSYPARLDELQFLGADGTNYSLLYGQGKATVMTGGIYAGWGAFPGVLDGILGNGGVHLLGKYVGLDFGANAPPIKMIKWWWYPGNESNAANISAHFSDDGVNWTTVYDGTGKGREITKTLTGDW
ncbi:putative Ig domain-containing protein [Agrobacterium salinitolerans]|nr:putative Ig domain-containing protein [Agrobacterium salinitolerans]